MHFVIGPGVLNFCIGHMYTEYLMNRLAMIRPCRSNVLQHSTDVKCSSHSLYVNDLTVVSVNLAGRQVVEQSCRELSE